ncbi:MAG: tetratricopeptide repeat protein [Bdellovibrionota bacterium]
MKNIAILLSSLLSLTVFAQIETPVQAPVLSPAQTQSVTTATNDLQIDQEDRKAFSQAYEFYKKEQFESSIAVLKKLKVDPNLMPGMYYLLGLNYYRIENYDLAEKYLSEVTRMNSIQEMSLAYYYLGLSQYYKGEYEKAVNSFELSIDASKDPEQDRRAERLIEKCIQIQNQLEVDKLKCTMGFTVGYGYDSNALNVAPQQDVLVGHILNASGFMAYKMYQDQTSIVEPMLYVADNRTHNHKLESTPEIQAADATTILASLPYKTMSDGYRSSTSGNIGLYMLPSDSEVREMSIVLLYFKQTLGGKLSADMDLDAQLIIGRDQSQLTFTDAEDNQTAIKYDISGALKYSLRRMQSITGELGFILNDADGDNASYYKAYTNLVYERPTFKNTYSSFKITYGLTNYNLSELARRDNFVSGNYAISKDLSGRTTINGFLGISRNDSTIEDYTYSDSSIGVQYVYLTRF